MLQLKRLLLVTQQWQQTTAQRIWTLLSQTVEPATAHRQPQQKQMLGHSNMRRLLFQKQSQLTRMLSDYVRIVRLRRF